MSVTPNMGLVIGLLGCCVVSFQDSEQHLTQRERGKSERETEGEREEIRGEGEKERRREEKTEERREEGWETGSREGGEIFH